MGFSTSVWLQACLQRKVSMTKVDKGFLWALMQWLEQLPPSFRMVPGTSILSCSSRPHPSTYGACIRAAAGLSLGVHDNFVTRVQGSRSVGVG